MDREAGDEYVGVASTPRSSWKATTVEPGRVAEDEGVPFGGDPKVKLVANGHMAFDAMDIDPRRHDVSPPGDYAATAWIPSDYLNEGLMHVDAAVCSIDSPKLHHHASIHKAVCFHVQDPAEGDSARGAFTGQWRGVVRPLLTWTRETR